MTSCSHPRVPYIRFGVSLKVIGCFAAMEPIPSGNGWAKEGQFKSHIVLVVPLIQTAMQPPEALFRMLVLWRAPVDA